jgi:predicted nucleic acid-binding protein
MELKYLWDTNTVIYYLQNQFSTAAEKFIDEVVSNFQPAISIITEIELLCWKTATTDDLSLINSFIQNAVVFELDSEIKSKTVFVRKNSGLKLPDAIIAATAINSGLTLISRNRNDFRKVKEMILIDPFEIV